MHPVCQVFGAARSGGADCCGGKGERGFCKRANGATLYAARCSSHGRKIPTVWASGFTWESRRFSAHEGMVFRAQAEGAQYTENPLQAHEEMELST